MQKNDFSVNDSSFAFILSIVIPNALAFLIIIFSSVFISPENLENTLFYKILATILSQISFFIVFLIITKKSKVSFKNVKFNKISFKNIIILILISLSCLFLISPIINVYDSFLTSVGIKASELPIAINKPINLIYLIFSLGILAPICEELLFRGIILQGLKEKGTIKAVLITSLMFMLMHLNLHQTIYQFVLSIIMCFIYLYTNSIFSTIFVHFINNTLVLLINYFSPQLFDYKFLSTNYIILALVLFVFGIYVIYNLVKLLNDKKNNNKHSLKQENINIIQNDFITNNSNLQTKKINFLGVSLIFSISMWVITILLSL